MLGEAAGKMAAKQIVQSEEAQRYAYALANIEADQLDGAIRQAEAAGIEHPEREWSVEQRATVLLDIMRAVFSGRFGEWWVETFGPVEFDSVPPAEWVGVGTDSEVWQSQLNDWAARVRERHPDVEATDRELASLACKNVYGVPLERIEETVVEMDQGAEVRRRLGGNFATARDLHRRVTEAIEDGEVAV
jgi:hypothetical protein